MNKNRNTYRSLPKSVEKRALQNQANCRQTAAAPADKPNKARLRVVHHERDDANNSTLKNETAPSNSAAQAQNARQISRYASAARLVIGLSVLVILLIILTGLIPKAQAGHGHGAGHGHFCNYGTGLAAGVGPVATETYVYQYDRNGLWYQAGVIRNDHRKLFPGFLNRGAAQYDTWSDYGTCPDYNGDNCAQPFRTYW